jgi:hypothetical protein
MDHSPADRNAQHEALQQIAAIRAVLIDARELTLPDLEALKEQLRPLAASADPLVAEAAGRVELRLIGAIMSAHGAAMRAMGEKVRQLARWLPPERPGDN